MKGLPAVWQAEMGKVKKQLTILTSSLQSVSLGRPESPPGQKTDVKRSLVTWS